MDSVKECAFLNSTGLLFGYILSKNALKVATRNYSLALLGVIQL